MQEDLVNGVEIDPNDLLELMDGEFDSYAYARIIKILETLLIVIHCRP
jgi:hypothetical protein